MRTTCGHSSSSSSSHSCSHRGSSKAAHLLEGERRSDCSTQQVGAGLPKPACSIGLLRQALHQTHTVGNRTCCALKSLSHLCSR